jgi:alpha-tubulin suppressor-like RCC1 family protein
VGFLTPMPVSVQDGGLNNKTTTASTAISILSKQQINQRDLFGRSLLHLAASSGDIGLLNATLDHPHVDVCAADFENGWTALHRALDHGNVSCAWAVMNQSRDLIRAKDRNKETPFELFEGIRESKQPDDIYDTTNEKDIIDNEDVDEAHEGIYDTRMPTYRMFTFGSNANHTLGFADQDNRAKPEMVRIRRPPQPSSPPRIRFQPISIKDVKISKMHTLVTTHDPAANLYVCRVPRGGRIGLTSDSTQFTFANFEGLPKNARVVDMAVGVDHTVVITSDNECFTCGSNRSGQVCSGSDGAPRRVLGEIRRKKLVGCAASNIHTVVFTQDELFCWGTNVGQMGFSDTEGGIENSPRKMLLDVGSISMVYATDIATVVLPADRQEVYVAMNSVFFRLGFPLQTAKLEFNIYTPPSFSRRPTITITKIAASPNGTVCALTSDGSVFSFALASAHGSGEKRPSLLAKMVKVVPVWVGRKRHLRARDVDIADDGSLILCTRGGSVWKRYAKASKGKFERVPYITRIRVVRCDPNFGSFAAICEDVMTPTLKIGNEKLNEDLQYLVSFVGHNGDRQQRRLLRHPVRKLKDFVFGYETIRTPNELTDVCQGLTTWLATCTEQALAQNLSELDVSEDDRGYDMEFRVENVCIPVHRAVVSSRCKVLADLVDMQSELLVGGGRIIGISSGIRCESLTPCTVVILIFYLYTDFSLKPWSMFPKSVPNHLTRARRELADLRKTLGLTSLWIEAYRDGSANGGLNGDLLNMNRPDVVIKLRDSEVSAHSYILTSRSAYFATMLCNRWARVYDSAGTTRINLDHIPTEFFDIVMLHVYGDREDDIFDGVKSESSKQFLRFVLDVLEVADELLLPKLREICEATVRHFGMSMVRLDLETICTNCSDCKERWVDSGRSYGVSRVRFASKPALFHLSQSRVFVGEWIPSGRPRGVCGNRQVYPGDGWFTAIGPSFL